MLNRIEVHSEKTDLHGCLMFPSHYEPIYLLSLIESNSSRGYLTK